MSQYLTCLLIGSILTVGLPGAALAQDAAGSGDETPVDSPFQFEPETPEQLLRAVLICQRLQRPLDAKRYLQRLIDPPIAGSDALKLRRQFGIGTFLTLYSDANLQPEAKQLLEAINEASVQVSPSAVRIQQLLAQPGPDAQTRAASVLEILSAGDGALPSLLEADPETDAGRLADLLLTRHAREYRHGLVEQLAVVDDPTRVHVLRLLYRTADVELVPRLLRWQFGPDVDSRVADQARTTILALAGNRPVPETREAAAATLTARVRDLLRLSSSRFGIQPVPGEQSLGRNDEEAARQLELADHLSKDLLVLAGDDASAQALQLAATLAGNEVPEESADLTMSELEDVLSLSRGLTNSNAAYQVLRLMQARFEMQPDELPDGALLADALADGDVRVRAAALKLMSASGQSVMAPLLFDRQAAALRDGSTRPEAVVIDPRPEFRTELVSVLSDAGYSASPAATGRDGFEAATGQLQCDLLLVHANCQRWPLSAAVANFRADGRTRDVPIVVYGPGWARDAVRRLARNYAGVWFLEEPVTQFTLFERLGYLNVPGPRLSADERAAVIASAPAAGN